MARNGSGNGTKNKAKTDRRKGREAQVEPEFDNRDQTDVRFDKVTPRAHLEPKNEIQARYIHSIDDNVLTIGTGPAGTGKTYVCATKAAQALLAKKVDKIVLTRPAVEAGENLGFLPGELEEKYEPYLVPFRDVLTEALGRTHLEYCLKNGKIEPAPLAFMRGRTFKNCFVILDEAQNVTPTQMKMFLTRVGENCTVIVNGDLKQKDIAGPSGLQDAINRLVDVRRVGWVEFTTEDIFRSGFVQDVVEAYND
jgi:phosphate starvation-inducible PhoH-like protein